MTFFRNRAVTAGGGGVGVWSGSQAEDVPRDSMGETAWEC